MEVECRGGYRGGVMEVSWGWVGVRPEAIREHGDFVDNEWRLNPSHWDMLSDFKNTWYLLHGARSRAQPPEYSRIKAALHLLNRPMSRVFRLLSSSSTPPALCIIPQSLNPQEQNRRPRTTLDSTIISPPPQFLIGIVSKRRIESDFPSRGTETYHHP